MPINIVKKENNNNVFIYDSATGDFIAAFPGSMSSISYSENKVFIKFNTGRYEIPISDVNSTQVEPSAAIPFNGSTVSLAELLSENFFFEVDEGGGGGGSADIPQIKGTSINYVPTQNSTLTAGVNQASTYIKGIVFDIAGTTSSTGIVLQVQNAGTLLHLALYKYDYNADIWNIATEQMDVSMVATGVVSQDFTTPQELTAGKYCVAFRDSDSTGQLTAFYKLRSRNIFSGNFTTMTGFYNTLKTDTISYSATMPATITFPIANSLENLYHEAFQIKF